MNTVEIVCKYLPGVELLAQAALKMRRALDGTNWTPKTLEECKAALEEEIADVEGVLLALDFATPLVNYDNVHGIQSAKMLRWARRLEEHHANDYRRDRDLFQAGKRPRRAGAHPG